MVSHFLTTKREPHYWYPPPLQKRSANNLTTILFIIFLSLTSVVPNFLPTEILKHLTALLKENKGSKSLHFGPFLHLHSISNHSEMKVRTLIAFKSKLFNPCRKLQPIFKFRFKRPLFLRALSVRRRSHQSGTGKIPTKNRFSALLSLFRFQKQAKEMDRVRELRSTFDAGQERRLFPSPLTPASMKVATAGKRVAAGHEDLEEACRSFENYLVEMIIEEGKTKDLMDVEELLYCWKNLKCPVFIDLVCRFYGELCKDLFSTNEEDNEESPQ